MGQAATSSARGGWGDRKIETMTDVSDALAHLGLPRLSEDVLTMIATSNSKGKFKAALQDCVSGRNVTAETKRYITGLVRTLSGVAQGLLQQLGYDKVAQEVLLYIGEMNGMAFYNAMAAALDKNSPNSAQGAEYVAFQMRDAIDHLGFSPQVKRPAPSQPVPSPRPRQSSVPAREVPAPQSSRANHESKPSDFRSTHVYGGKAAICFNAATSREGDHFTVIVDGAKSVSERTYDWKRAISIQLGHRELPLLYGVLVGWRNSVKFDAHGAAHDKIFEFERQDGKFFAKVMGKDGGQAVAHAVPVGPMDAYPIMTLVLGQIVKEAPKEIQGDPRIIIEMMKAAQQIKPVGG